MWWVVTAAGLLGASAAVLTAIPRLSVVARATAYVWHLPPGFPEPRVPDDNPMSVEKVLLGRHLFYDTRLSADGTFSCATCHQQARAFTDGKGRGVGVTGEVHPRGPMSLANVAYASVLTWANPTVRRLEAQALVPMFGTDPVELGLAGQATRLLARLTMDPRYQRLFAAAFPNDAEPFTVGHITEAIAAFERTLLSGRSPYDRYRTTMDASAIPPAAHRGEDLFFSERLSCFRCHSGFNFTQAVESLTTPLQAVEFHNNGLYNIDGKGSYPAPNTGIHAVTGRPEDMGRYKAPTLRNVALTAPYMHDGSLPTLEAVIDHYEAGGRTVAAGPHAGRGASSPFKSPFVKGFTLTAVERADLLAFLESLTDTAFITDPALSNPWVETLGSPGTVPRPAARTRSPQPGGSSNATASIDFEGALRRLDLDPDTTDLNRGTASEGTILDADELALITAILSNRVEGMRAPGALDQTALMEAFRQARATAVDDLRILSAAYPGAADLAAGYALLGEGAFTAFTSAAKKFGFRFTGDYTAAWRFGRYLSVEGDADGDGVTNLLEYRASIARGRSAYVRAALDSQTTAGAGPPR
ncbi:MAG: MbnH family di-heme enzyme [Vicinamibacterales bacterium]